MITVGRHKNSNLCCKIKYVTLLLFLMDISG